MIVFVKKHVLYLISCADGLAKVVGDILNTVCQVENSALGIGREPESKFQPITVQIAT
jgi:hypothetical protein